MQESRPELCLQIEEESKSCAKPIDMSQNMSRDCGPIPDMSFESGGEIAVTKLKSYD